MKPKAKDAMLSGLDKLFINPPSIFPDFYGMRKIKKTHGGLFNRNEL
jgi:hypothetical protein